MEDLRRLLSVHRIGRFDPTTELSSTEFWQASRTPQGPGTLHLVVDADGTTAEGFGPGGAWLERNVDALTGLLDPPAQVTPVHDAVKDALERFGLPTMTASRDIYRALIPAILGQRVTAQEALSQWSKLCRLSPEVAPGPHPLLMPPDPLVIGATPYWVMHRLGIERRRADLLGLVSRRYDRIAALRDATSEAAATMLMAFPGIGVWTVAETLSVALGDPDSLSVGDFHLKNVVAFALAGKPRGTDDEMVAVLEPYRGQRGRVVRMLLNAGWHAPRYGPRQAILPVSRW